MRTQIAAPPRMLVGPCFFAGGIQAVTPNRLTDVGELPGSGSGQPWGINSLAQVAGFAGWGVRVAHAPSPAMVV